MAGRAQPVGAATSLGGGVALALVAALTLGTLAALLRAAPPGQAAALGPADWAAVRFTLLQSLLSASLSVAFAVPAARALARRRFPGRAALVALLGAPFLLPAVVAVFGILAIWGNAGALSRGLQALGGPALDPYGLGGVVLAHVFFNLPLVTRLLLQSWLAMPSEQFRLAAQLGFGRGAVFRHIEVPMLRVVLPGAFVLVFLLCMTSFAVALTLGGGPRATTLELAIYQAIRFDFDLARAALLALIQLGFCAAVAILALGLAADAAPAQGLCGHVRRWDAQGAAARVQDLLVLAALGLFVGLPLAAILARGLAALGGSGLPAAAWPAALRSLSVALASGALAILLGLGLAQLIDVRRAGGGGRALEAFALLALAASPFVVGTGLFLLLHPLADPFALALPVTATVNATMALPFVLRTLRPALTQLRVTDGRLADSLGMTGWSRFRLVAWPRLRRSLGFAAGLAAALSMGDLGVIALFAPPEIATLPLLMQRLMAAYRMDAAAAVGLALVGLTYALFWTLDRIGGRDAAA